MADNYQYQPTPLPPSPDIGGDFYDGELIADLPTPNVGVQSMDPTNTPYGQPTASPLQPTSGGSGGSCSDDFTAQNVKCAAVVFPCADPTSSVTDLGISLSNQDSPAVEWLNIFYTDMSLADDVLIKLQELDVCHMGAAGKRKFVCGDAYS